MRIVFIGAIQFSAKLLAALIRIGANVVGVCTLEEAPFNADHMDLTGIANAAGIAVRYTSDINTEESIEWIKMLAPDVVFCFGWSRMIKQPLLSLAPLGVVGYHPAALPANRGRHPLIWALALGLEYTGSTFFFMNEGVDSGDILSQRMLIIDAADDAGSLYGRICAVAVEQLREFVPALESGQYARVPQVEAEANYWRKRGRPDGQIDWRMSARSIHNLVRALSHPYPGAHFMLNGQEIKVWCAEVTAEPCNNIEPGKVLAVDAASVTVKAGIDAVRLLATDPAITLRSGNYL